MIVTLDVILNEHSLGNKAAALHGVLLFKLKERLGGHVIHG